MSKPKFTEQDRKEMRKAIKNHIDGFLRGSSEYELKLSAVSFEAGYLAAMTIFKDEIMKARGEKR